MVSYGGVLFIFWFVYILIYIAGKMVVNNQGKRGVNGNWSYDTEIQILSRGVRSMRLEFRMEE